jgi:hypothetical protein
MVRTCQARVVGNFHQYLCGARAERKVFVHHRLELAVQQRGLLAKYPLPCLYDARDGALPRFV